jgi:hypothetical protein
VETDVSEIPPTDNFPKTPMVDPAPDSDDERNWLREASAGELVAFSKLC